jgi:hypothetical protein
MSNYVKSVDFAVKDALIIGDPAKKTKGTEVDTEFNNIATAIATKANSNGDNATGTWSIDVNGNAATATKLQTARTISLSGTVVGSASFDGSANATINTSIATPADGNWFNGIPKVRPDGVMEIGKYVDFHETSAGTADFDGRLGVEGGGELYYNKNGGPLNLVYHSGNLSAATESSAGIVEMATAAEAQALASATVALTPARLADAFKGANQSLSSSGYQKLPGGLIIQWGNATTNTAVTFPITFPSACRQVFVSNSAGSTWVAAASSITNTGFSLGGWVPSNGVAGNFNASWLAIGI